MSTQTMPPTNIPLTIIVATTPSLGIGFKNTLPWPQLKAEMAYFARVTKRLPSSTSPGPATSGDSSIRKNAVIMGRSTYLSIPRKFRPLKDRLNIILTRSQKGSEVFEKLQEEASSSSSAAPLRIVSSLPEAMSLLDDLSKNEEVGRGFVIGGAEIYKQALEHGSCDRILRTRVEKEYECDVHFPVQLDGQLSGWKQAERQGLSDWVGEDVPESQEQDGVRWKYEMWTRAK